ncbi:MAG: phosphonate C-P lyase system protein PhnH [Meiothermus sp.]|nr:phosphonate C-P lyase system protein PhnH [Meiothermus sp.]
MTTPFLTPQEAQNQAVFRALLRAMSRPGQGYRLAPSGEAALKAIGQALLDLETRFYTPDPGLRARLSQLGARAVGPGEADYLFFTELGEPAWADLEQAPIGSLLHPEEGATVVALSGPAPEAVLRLAGPGLPAPTLFESGLPARFWALRNQRVRFPLGWDVLLLEASGLCRAVPRSTLVEVT